MASCSCSTAASSTSKAANFSADHTNIPWATGSLSAGATIDLDFTSNKGDLTIAMIRVPNVLGFTEDPCLVVGDKLIFDSVPTGCMKNTGKCVTVTVAPVKVGSFYEIGTDGNWNSPSGVNQLELTTAVSSMFCDQAATTTAFTAKVCAKTPDLNKFSGYLFTRPLNSKPVTGGAYVVTGSSTITMPKNPGIKEGDKIELFQTGIVGANSAIVKSISRGNTMSNTTYYRITLDRVVTSVAVVADSQGRYCVDFESRPAAIASLRFEASCGCRVSAILDAAVSSSPNFPMGTLTDSDCPKQAYCYVINGDFEGADHNNISGQIYL